MNKVSVSNSVQEFHRANAGATTAGSAGVCLVLISSSFNLLLCFFATRHWISGDGNIVIACELIIMAIGLVVIRPFISDAAIASGAAIIIIVMVLKLTNLNINLKILHDLGLTYIFYKLGTLAAQQTANRLLSVIMVLVLVFGFSRPLYMPRFSIFGLIT
jgi:hypothetical protein